MEIIEDDKITVVENGVEKSYDLLFSFDCEENGRRYVGYTDNTFDNEGKLKIEVSSFDPEAEEVSFKPLLLDEEWDMVDEVIESIRNGQQG